jgi:hypothetical protein
MGLGHEQGAAPIQVGVAANASIGSGQRVSIADLFELRPEAHHLSQLI